MRATVKAVLLQKIFHHSGGDCRVLSIKFVERCHYLLRAMQILRSCGTVLTTYLSHQRPPDSVLTPVYYIWL